MLDQVSALREHAVRRYLVAFIGSVKISCKDTFEAVVEVRIHSSRVVLDQIIEVTTATIVHITIADEA